MNWKDKKIVIYTCIYGNYDNLGKQVEQDINCDYICLTDNTNLVCDLFKIIIFQPIQSPIISKYIDTNKFGQIHHNIINTVLCRSTSDLLDPLKEYDIWIYMDANVYLTESNTISKLLNKCQDTHLMLFSQHPERNNIFSEAHVSSRIHKYNNTNVLGQVNSYKSLGHIDDHLFWNGFFIFLKPFDSIMKQFYQDYTNELLSHYYDINKKFHPKVNYVYLLFYGKIICMIKY